jgi:preprotein translocase subunit SecY
MLLLAIFLQIGERRLKVQYANRKNPFGHATTSYLPLKVNGSGVIPVIFVGAIMTLPDVINIFWPGNGFSTKFNEFMKLPTDAGINGYSTAGIAIYSLLLYAFAFFYVTIQLDPVKISENISNSNGFIVGYKPGYETERYVRKVINRITVLGGFLLVIIAVTPLVVQTASYYYAQSNTANTELISTINQFQVLFQFGGTGLLIVVSVIMQIYKRIKGRISVRKYEEFQLVSSENSVVSVVDNDSGENLEPKSNRTDVNSNNLDKEDK